MTGRRPLVLIVPGLAVRRYATPARRALEERGYRAELLASPARRGAPVRVADYGMLLAQRIEERGERVALLVGLSVGSQAAAVAAAQSALVERLLLVSPTVDPANRSRRRLLAAWLFGNEGPKAPGASVHWRDWAGAGIPRILLGLHGALQVPIEDELARRRIPTAIVHAEHDPLGTRDWARRLAARYGAEFVPLDGAPHSWPFGDAEGFAALVERITRTERTTPPERTGPTERTSG